MLLRCVAEESLAYATAQAKLAAGPALRRNYMAIKHKAKGQVARMVMVSTTGRFPTTFLTACGNLTPALGCVLQRQEHTFPGKELPSALARNEAATAQVKEKYPYLLSHLTKEYPEPPVVDPEAVQAAMRVARL